MSYLSLQVSYRFRKYVPLAIQRSLRSNPYRVNEDDSQMPSLPSNPGLPTEGWAHNLHVQEFLL
jgi:hypothetical protein